MAVFDLFDLLVFRGSNFVFFDVPREVDFSLFSALLVGVLFRKITGDFAELFLLDFFGLDFWKEGSFLNRRVDITPLNIAPSIEATTESACLGFIQLFLHCFPLSDMT